ncbi:hypothetical protein DXT94_31915 [Rhizobium sp. ICMP 5592]|nr:hypothetical protein [Rhizobium sp. ICMP 5592]
MSAVRQHLAYRGRGNPPMSHPISAISNCFPGLEFDLRNMWRRMFRGITLTEHSNLVRAVSDDKYSTLLGCRLLAIDGTPVMVQATGPIYPGSRSQTLPVPGNPEAVAFMEWSNTFALIQHQQGKMVPCVFTAVPPKEGMEILWTRDAEASVAVITVELEVEQIFDTTDMQGTPTMRAALSRTLAEPGEMTQGLCSPWQNDYRECACYYWAASRPDYVNVEPGPDGASQGAMWMQKDHSKPYIPDRVSVGNRTDDRLVGYDDLFAAWEHHLRFVIGGRVEDLQGQGGAGI